MNAQTKAKRICLIGATGLLGQTILAKAVTRPDIRIVGVARREIALPVGARMEMLLAEPAGWRDAIASANAQVLVCALGTTRRKAGGEEAFRAVDRDLVLTCAEAARDVGIDHMIAVTSIGADLASTNLYLRVKGEAEHALGKVGLRRLDIVRPGLLRGPRQESRPMERMAMWLSPIADLLMHGKYRKCRSIRAVTLADAIFALAQEKAAGRFFHDRDSLLYAIRRAGD